MSSFYVYETQYENPRKCDWCEKGMAEGYLDEISITCYCSKECLGKAYKTEDVEGLVDLEDIYWTDWHDEVEAVK